jgi:hypothetical protein
MRTNKIDLRASITPTSARSQIAAVVFSTTRRKRVRRPRESDQRHSVAAPGVSDVCAMAG